MHFEDNYFFSEIYFEKKNLHKSLSRKNGKKSWKRSFSEKNNIAKRNRWALTNFRMPGVDHNYDLDVT